MWPTTAKTEYGTLNLSLNFILRVCGILYVWVLQYVKSKD